MTNTTALTVFGTHEANTLSQLADVATRAERVALMADGHLGYIMPIGGVAAYRNQVSVVGVGFDIACGNCAIRTDLHVDHIRDVLDTIGDEVQDTLSFGMGRNNRCNDAPVDHPLFESPAWDAVPDKERQGLKARARNQLGTIGSGNHYVDVFVDEHAAVWVGVHFGSRGLGHTIASAFLALAQAKQWGDRVPETECLLDLDSPLGHDYWHLMSLAGEYAYAGREWVTRKVVEMIGGKELEMIHNHHNFAWKEQHDGFDFVVVRKGATPAFPAQKGFVGGSMGDDAVIVEGAPDSELAREAMFSTVHGAGRVMSRTAAAGKTKRRKVWACGQRGCDGSLPASVSRNSDGSNPKCPKCDSKTHQRETLEVVKQGAVTEAMRDEWIGRRGLVLRGGGLDEAPQVYRRLPDVLAAQGDTINVLHTLTPLIVVMAGANEYDPYKD